MEISSLCPFRVSTLVWEAQPSQFSLTVTVKATFALVHGGEARIAELQEPIGSDRHWDDRPMASLFAPADAVPSKRKVDVLLVGHARAPNAAPVTSLVARFALGDAFDKSIRVTGDRIWEAGSDGALRPSAPVAFVTMPLRFERAPLSAENPVGIDAAAPAIVGAPSAPNLESTLAETMGGFGPVASTWRDRRTKVDDAGLFWAYGVASDSPARPGPPPSSFDFSFFNAAPAEQQIELVRPGTKIELENMSAEHPKLESAVPAIRPQVFRVAKDSGRAEEITLRCDTLWIDVDRNLLVLTFRGVADAGHGDDFDLGSLVVVADPAGKKMRWDRVQKLLETADMAPTPDAVDDDARERDPLSVRYDAVLDEATKGKVKAAPSEPPARRVSEPPRPRSARERSTVPPRPSQEPKTVPPPPMPLPPPPPRSGPGSIPVAARLAPPLVAATPRLITPLERDIDDDEPEPEKTQPLAIHALAVPTVTQDEESTAGETEPDVHKSIDDAVASSRSTHDVHDLEEPTRAKRSDRRLPTFPGARLAAIDPADVGLFAAVSAHLARKGIDRALVLEAHGMTDVEFASLAERWRATLEGETDRGKRDLASAFDMAYVAAQERLDPPIGIVEYAQIVVALERGNVGRVLAELDLELSDLMRLQRVWSRRVSTSNEVRNSLDAAIEAMRRE